MSIINYKSLKIASLIGAFFLFQLNLFGQQNLLELLPGTQKLVFHENNTAQKLIGNVNFKYQGNLMYCDSAYFYEKTKEVKAYGRVHINKNDTLNLFCDSLYYNGNTKYAKLWGHVRVRDREYKVTTDSMDYDARLGRASYKYWAKVENIETKEVLTSKIGNFHPDTKNFYFSGKVVYKSPELNMTTDTLKYNYLTKKVYFFGPSKIRNKDVKLFCDKGWYQTETKECVLQKNAKIINEGKTIVGDSLYNNPKKKLAIGKGNIVYTDSLEPIILKGNYFYKNDLTNRSFITGKALCIYQTKKDTIYIHSDTLFAYQDTTIKKVNKIIGYNNSRIINKDIQGKCDTLIYLKKEGTIDFKSNPIIWAKNAELKGENMKAYLKDSILEKIDILEKASVVMELDSGNYYNQIAGKNIIATFRDNKLVKADVKANAQTIYYPEDKKEKDTIIEIKRSGMGRIYASDLRIDLDSGEVKRITYIDKPDAVFYPMDQIKIDEQFIPNFSWNPLLRPRRKEDIFKKNL